MDGKSIIAGRREPKKGAAGTYFSASRRRILTGAILALAFAVSFRRAIGRERAEGPPHLDRQATTPPSSPTESSGAVPAVTELDGRMTTEVVIDGQGPFHFMVDTGAERTVIAGDIAERLGLPRGREVMVEGIVRSERASLVEIRELEMGSLTCSRLEVPALPRSMLYADGYLGLDVLDGRRVIFDFIARTITVTRPQGFFSSLWARFTDTDEVRVPTLGSSGRLRATDCHVDDVSAAAFIDSGAEVSIINQALYAALQRRSASQAINATETLTGVTGGSIVGATTMLDMVHLGELVLTFTPAVVVSDLPVFGLWGLNRQPALLIGMDTLRRCARVSIDYRRKELHFELASAQTAQPLQAGLPPPLAG